MRNVDSDTIVAIATAPGAAGIAIVRVSGPEALQVADRMFHCRGQRPSQRPSHTIVHGRVCSTSGETLDEALLLIMRAPHSYTGEDVVEFQCHGGTVSAARILRRATEVGCRIAEPGEFTKRAFLNGRMDLSQAEGVLALIQAGSERAADAALRVLRGELGREVNRVYDAILSASANLDASLDFPEEDLPSDTLSVALQTAREAKNICARLLSTWSCGKILRDGFRVAIVGRANAGKSTLFNMLAGLDRAIVSEHPGTTRDTIECWTHIRGFSVCLVDTAGFASTACPIESEGIRRSWDEVQASNMIIYCLPINDMYNSVDFDYLQSMPPKPILVALTKCDLECPQIKRALPRELPCVETTILDQNRSAELVKYHIANVIESEQHTGESAPVIILERHRTALESAVSDLDQAIALMESGRDDSMVLASECLKSAADSLARITGRSFDSELLNEIFGSFCIGK